MPIAVILLGQSNPERNANNIEVALQSEYGPETVLIRCARGGFTLAELAALVEQDITLIQQYQGAGFTIKSIFLQHGESDARVGTSEQDYKTFMLAYVNRIRVGIGIPFLPVIYAQLGKVPAFWDAAKWAAIQRANAAMLTGHSSFHMFSTNTLGPYESGKPGCHYHDNIADPSWPGTGYKEITYGGFMTKFRSVMEA